MERRPASTTFEIDVQLADDRAVMRIETHPHPRDGFMAQRPADDLLLGDILKDDVVKTRSHPFRVALLTASGTTVSMPGRARLHTDGIWDIVDHRTDAREFDDDGVRRDVFQNRLAAAALGARHVSETRETSGSPTFRANVRQLAIYRTIVPTIPQQATARHLLATRSRPTLGDLADALHRRRACGMTLAFGLVLGRFVSMDMQSTIGPDSRVSTVVPVPAIMPGLFDALRMPRAGV